MFSRCLTTGAQFFVKLFWICVFYFADFLHFRKQINGLKQLLSQVGLQVTSCKKNFQLAVV